MKSPLEAPEKQIAEETSAKPEKPAAAVIDTSKMAKGQREALELAEAARDPLEDRGSFASNLFIGRYDFDRIYPYPAQSAEDRAAGEISAFALTEVHAGSDPATLSLKAEPTADGSEFVLNGEKLWCTNGVKAGVLVVMARTPSKMVGGKERKQITAFIVDVDTPGLEIAYRCRFMGLRALYNAVVKFTNVRVPRENIIFKEGAGLRVALTTLNTGRLTLPAACVGLSKRLLEISRKWAGERIQWGVPIGKHAAIAGKIAEKAGNVFGMVAMTFLTSSLLDCE